MDTSKIIKGVVSNGRYTVTAPIVKEDYGLYLKIEGVELPPTYEVDFSNSENSGTSVTMIGNSDGVLIPSQFISTGKDVFAFLYHVGEDFGRTVYKFRIPNKVRPDRTNEQPTPEEQSTIDQLIGAMNTAVAQTAQDKADADASAQSASADAERAEDAKTDAQNFAIQAEQATDDAQTYANSASASASASAQSASQSAQIKADVEELVDDAQAAANASERSASNAYTYATSAERSSVNASSSAQSASGYASQAQSSANTASAKAQDASQSATTASQKATESAQSASQALTYKTDAETAKTASQTAQGLAESARDSAITAKTDAEQAKADAESARDEAQTIVDGISGALADKADVITDTASGSIASFPDGADDIPLKSLVVDIDPVQDLHGQESPYPAGGGKNLIIPPEYTATTPTLCLDLGADTEFSAITLQFKATDAVTLYNNAAIIDFLKDDETHQYVTLADFYNENGVKFTPNTVLNGTFSSTKTNVTFRQAYIYYEYNSFAKFQSDCLTEWQLAVGSTPTDYAPYENICPISGWTSVDVEQRGVNVWDEEWELGDISSSTGENVTSNAVIRTKNYIPVKPNTKYYAYINNSGPGPVRSRFYDVNKNYIGSAPKDRSAVAYNQSFITPDNCYYMRFTPQAAYGTTYNHDISINYPSTDHSYHPYTGRSITINLGQTVYGGKLDVLSGALTVDRAMVDLGTLSWNYVASSACNFRASELIGAKAPATAVVTPNAICSILTVLDYTTVSTPVDGITIIFATSAQAGKVWAHSGTYTDATAFKAAMTGQTLVYELATPLTVQLTPNQVNSLLGVNNIWADSGDTEVEYRANTKLWVQKKIAEAIASLS